MDEQQHHNAQGFSMDVPETGHETPQAWKEHAQADISEQDKAMNESIDRPAQVSSIYPPVHDRPHTPEPMVRSIEQPTAPASYSMSMPFDDRPIPVVKVLSVRGVEYAMMSILLWFGAGSLIFILVSIIQGGASFETLAFPLSLLLVTTPGFAYLYLRLRRAELDTPSLRLEPSKRRFSQITQIVAFLTCFFNIVTVVYMLLSIAGGAEGVSVGKTLGSAVAVLAVAGGILAYYWIDEHRQVRG